MGLGRRATWGATAAFVTRLALGFIALCAPALGASGDGVFWVVDDRGRSTSRVYLLGSVHFGKADMYPMSATVNRAFDDAERLVVEVDLLKANSSENAGIVRSRGELPSNTSVLEGLSPATADRLRSVLAERNLELSRYEGYRPWFLSWAFINLSLRESGYSEAWGVDLHYLKAARAAGKPVVELESLAQQINLLANLGADYQEQLLVDALDILTEESTQFEEIFAAWTAGDLDRLERLIHRSFEAQGDGVLLAKLITDRNRSMADAVVELLAEGGVSFVVVGAGHLVGAEGVPATLRDKGYEVNLVGR